MIKIVNEATMNRGEIEQEYQQYYGKKLDWKKVPCIVARDKFLSGWGEADGKTHYQVILCYDAPQAATMCDYAKYHAKELQVSNVRWNYGFKPTSGQSYSYILACDAPVFGGTDRGVVQENVRPMKERSSNWSDWYEHNNQIKMDIANERDEIIFGEPFVKEEYVGGIRRFKDLDIDRLQELIAIGAVDVNDRQNAGPTVEYLIDFENSLHMGNLTFEGYAVSPAREDCRVSIDGCTLYNGDEEDLALFKSEFGPDGEYPWDWHKEDSNYCSAWWD